MLSGVCSFARSASPWLRHALQMGISCASGGTFAGNSTCRTDGSRDLRGAVTPRLRTFEDRVLAQHFEGASVAQWEQSPRYHA